MSSRQYIALKIHDMDNVATVFNDINTGEEVMIQDKKGNEVALNSISNLIFGHKIAIREINKEDKIIKYGEEIGIATKDISAGEHVHVHNLDSARGRGDWQDKTM